MERRNTSPDHLPVAVDAMGGDMGPGVVVRGAVDAANKLGIPSIIVGDEEQISRELKHSKIKSKDLIDIVHASQVVTMEDSPSVAIRKKPDASVRVAFELVKEGRASSVLSPGNTGAMMASGVYVSGTIQGVARPAIASLIPRVGDLPPSVLLDSGANIDCHANQLVQFAVMGSYYAHTAISCKNPRVAVLSNGTERSKGNDITRSAAMCLSAIKEINFVGYIEGKDLFRDVADVIVCDGFVGNIALKTLEGSAELVIDSMRHLVQDSVRGKFAHWLLQPILRSLFRDKLNPSAYGGAPLLGLKEIAVVCHGSSNDFAIMNGIRVASKLVDEGLVGKVKSAVGIIDADFGAGYEDGIWGRMEDRYSNKEKNSEAEEIEDNTKDQETVSK